MPIDLYSTRTMLAAKELVKPQATFLRDRYFPTSEANIFDTEKVIIDYKDEAGNKLAPVVLPIKGGIPVAREGYETEEMTPRTRKNSVCRPPYEENAWGVYCRWYVTRTETGTLSCK